MIGERRLASGLLVAVLWCGLAPGGAAAAGQQDEGRGAGRQGRSGGVSVAEAERLFDRYALGQARVALQLTPDQLVRFGQRFERLQVAQRQRQRQRQRGLAELAAAGRSGQGADEAAVADLLDVIDRESAVAEQQVRVARQRLEEVLSVRQRARFRAFEARMERERLRLIARARDEARQEAGGAAAAGEGAVGPAASGP